MPETTTIADPKLQAAGSTPQAKAAAPKHAATASHLQFSDIGMDMVTLKDNSARAVIEITPICLDFHTEVERADLTRRYAAFLNALDAPLQVLLKSRQLDMDGYLSDLKTREDGETRPFFKGQLKDYRELLEKFLPYSGYGIMRRQAYIVVPYELPTGAAAPSQAGGDPLSNLLALFSPGKILREARARSARQQQLREGLNAEVEKLLAAIAPLGLVVRRLSTLELLRMFTRTYHPATHDTAHAELFEQFDSLAHPTVS